MRFFICPAKPGFKNHPDIGEYFPEKKPYNIRDAVHIYT
jgi:hypothetical protein